MTVSSQILGHRIYQMYSFNFKFLVTLSNYYLFTVYGMLYLLPSVALTDIAYLMKMDMITADNGITLRAVAYSIGSLACGHIFRKFDRRLGLIIGMFTAALCLSTLPFLNSVAIFLSSMFVMGFISGSIDVAVNSWILDLWGDNCNTYMQALHASYGIGMFLAPFYTAQFLGLQPRSSNQTKTEEEHKFFIDLADSPVEINKDKSLESFRLVFALFSFAILLSALIQLVLYIIENRKINQITSKLHKDDDALKSLYPRENDLNESNSMSSLTPRQAKTVLILASLILFIYVGMEVNSVNFAPQFIINLRPKEDKIVEKAADQSTILNGAFALFRILGIFVSRFLTSDTMVVIHLSMIVVSSILLLFVHVNFIVIPIAFSLFGAGCSTIFPCVYSMIEERTKLTNFQVGLLMFAGSIASVLYPLIVPHLLERYPMIYVYNNVISITIVFICVITLIMKAKRPMKM